MLLCLILRLIGLKWKPSISKFLKRLKNFDNTTKSKIVSELLEVLQSYPSLELRLLGKNFGWLRQNVNPQYDFPDRSQS